MAGITVASQSVASVLWLTGGTKREASEFQSVPLIAPRAFYAVKMLDFLVDGTSVGVNSSVYNVYGEGCIVDTGTSVPSLPAPAFDSMSAQLHSMCSHGTFKQSVGRLLK